MVAAFQKGDRVLGPLVTRHPTIYSIDEVFTSTDGQTSVYRICADGIDPTVVTEDKLTGVDKVIWFAIANEIFNTRGSMRSPTITCGGSGFAEKLAAFLNEHGFGSKSE